MGCQGLENCYNGYGGTYNRTIKDYGTFLNRVKFDENTVNLINRIIPDEVFHKDTWKSSIEELTSQEA
jgi:hypothetical protein